MSQIKNVVNIRYKINYGSAFILPAVEESCLFLISAHHVFERENSIEFDELEIYDFNDNKTDFD